MIQNLGNRRSVQKCAQKARSSVLKGHQNNFQTPKILPHRDRAPLPLPQFWNSWIRPWHWLEYEATDWLQNPLMTLVVLLYKQTGDVYQRKVMKVSLEDLLKHRNWYMRIRHTYFSTKLWTYSIEHLCFHWKYITSIIYSISFASNFISVFDRFVYIDNDQYM